MIPISKKYQKNYREDGKGELYTYIPLTAANTAAQLRVPGTLQNDKYGFSVGRGAFTFPTGEWVSIAEYVKLNDPAENNGEVRVYVNGEMKIELEGVALVADAYGESGTIQGMMWQTFFGGELFLFFFSVAKADKGTPSPLSNLFLGIIWCH